MALAACSGGSKGNLRQLPVQLGHPSPPTPTPYPTNTPIPPPPCNTPSVNLVQWSEEKGPSADTRLVVGQVKSNCSVAVDVTLMVRWLDGPESAAGPRAFATLRRVLPGETRPFSEVVAGGKGATKVELSADAENVSSNRRR